MPHCRRLTRSRHHYLQPHFHISRANPGLSCKVQNIVACNQRGHYAGRFRLTCAAAEHRQSISDFIIAIQGMALLQLLGKYHTVDSSLRINPGPFVRIIIPNQNRKIPNNPNGLPAILFAPLDSIDLVGVGVVVLLLLLRLLVVLDSGGGGVLELPARVD